MNVVVFNGSARTDGDTAILVEAVFAELERRDRDGVRPADGEGDPGCTACGACVANRDRWCAVRDELLDDCIENMLEADGIILASPKYCADVSAGMKALIDRAGLVTRANRDMFRRKVGASVIAALRAGAIHAFDTMDHLFFIGQMIVPGFSYRNIGPGGLGPGDVQGDEGGQMILRTPGANAAWLPKIAD